MHSDARHVDKGYLLPVAMGCLWMLSDAVSEVMHGLMIKDVTICSGMSMDAVGCSKCNDAWPDDNRYYQM